ncbi:MAG: 16S rRNA (uracil(1498)-N(3))-methyltransferase [Campylobacterota bacterium]
MQFLYHRDAGEKKLVLQGPDHKYLAKVRRIQRGQSLQARNLKDKMSHTYRVENIDKKKINITLLQSVPNPVPAKTLHLGWCVVDAKSVEKTLPFLNEAGVTHITFIYCDKSQQNFKLNFTRLEKILINSCQQCGRDHLMELGTEENVQAFVAKHPDAWLCDFGGEKITDQAIKTLIIGPEGGFSDAESAMRLPKAGFDSSQILRSETAATAAAAKLLL